MCRADGEAVDYLIKPPTNLHTPRHGAAITILILYSIFLLFMASAFFRLIYTVVFNPGYVPRGPQWYAQQDKRKKGTERGQSGRYPGSADDDAIGGKQTGSSSSGSNAVTGVAYSPPNGQAGPSTTESAPGLQDFFSRDIFVCQGDGRPIWCSKCLNWKPDRAHHCREVDRCVRKMDHFCPWVGGVVSETSFKFFIQFTGWTVLFTLFNLITMAKFVAEYRNVTGTANIHWIITTALAALFFLFTLGMTGSSLQFALVNTTTIENLSRKSIVWDLAIRMPKLAQQPPAFPTISFSTAQPTDQNPAASSIKTFAILHSKPGDNPWNLGAFRNFKSVMGEQWYDWFLPLRYSPCCDHERDDCQFEVGPEVGRMRKEAGIALPEEMNGEKSQHRRHRHRRRQRRTPRGDTPTGDGSKQNEREKQREERDASDMV